MNVLINILNEYMYLFPFFAEVNFEVENKTKISASQVSCKLAIYSCYYDNRTASRFSPTEKTKLVSVKVEHNRM